MVTAVEEDKPLKAIGIFFTTLAHSAEVLFEAGESKPKVNQGIGEAMAIAYLDTALIRLADRIQNIGIVTTTIINGGLLDLNKVTLQDGMFLPTDVKTVVDDINKSLKKEGKQIGTHINDLFLG